MPLIRSYVCFHLRFIVLKAMSCDTTKALFGWGELTFDILTLVEFVLSPAKE